MNYTKWLTLGVLAISAIACDPYTKGEGGTPNIQSVTATTGSLYTDGTLSGSTWSAKAVCWDPNAVDANEDPIPGGAPQALPVIWVALDRQVNGAAIQSKPPQLTTGDPGDCTPANNWLTATPAAPAGTAWYSCYAPSSPTPTQGGSVVIYLANTGGSPGWGDADNGAQEIPSDLGTIAFTGSLAGQAIDIRIDASVPASQTAGVTCLPEQ